MLPAAWQYLGEVCYELFRVFFSRGVTELCWQMADRELCWQMADRVYGGMLGAQTVSGTRTTAVC